jgi:alkylhydroperoxidase family enzyme
MSRVAGLPEDQWPEDLKQAAGKLKRPDPRYEAMGILAQTPDIARALGPLGVAIKSAGLPQRLLELTRLRMAFHNQCRSCMAIRYSAAIADGVDEGLVCSLEQPAEAPDLTEAERAALDFCDRFATNHLSIDETVYDRLREHFTEQEIVQLGCHAALCVGFGRLHASWALYEDLPREFHSKDKAAIAPWAAPSMEVV